MQETLPAPNTGVLYLYECRSVGGNKVLFMLNKELMLRGNAMKQKENLFSFRKQVSMH